MKKHTINLFTFPHAGGSSVIFFKWKKILDKHIHLFQFEYSGHGSRIKEPLFTSVESIVKEACTLYNNNFFEKPFALFGHSMGAIVAMELSLLLYKKHKIIGRESHVSGQIKCHPKAPSQKKERE